MVRIIALVISVAALVWAEDNDVTEGSCSTQEDDKCSEPTDEKDQREKYEKLKWTDDYDYDIREKLDEADDQISFDREKAVSLFQDILSSHPDSNRAHYSLARTYVVMMHEANLTSQKMEYCDLARQNLKIILSKEDNLEVMDNTAANLLLHISETETCFSRDDILESLRVLRRGDPEGRYGCVLCHELLLAGHLQEALDESESILKTKPTEFLLNIIKV